jgi:hypothetical protein
MDPLLPKAHPGTHLEWKSLGWILPVEEPGYRLGYAQAVFANAEPVSLIIEEVADGTLPGGLGKLGALRRIGLGMNSSKPSPPRPSSSA